MTSTTQTPSDLQPAPSRSLVRRFQIPGSGKASGTRRRWTKKRIIALVLVLALLGAAAVGLYRLFFVQEERQALTGTTTYGSLNEALEGSGTTTPADSVTYDVSGTVLEWYVEEGDDVEAGDLLYVLDSSEAEDQILEYEVDLESLYQQLSELQENIRNQQVTAEFSGRVESVQAEEGDKVQSGTVLANLVDDSAMKATLYFSYAYQDAIYVGMPVTVSIPDQMLTPTGKVTGVQYVDYVTPEGMRCFAVTVEIDNPGSLTQGTTATCWIEGEDGSPVYAVGDAQLDYVHSATITAQASGELTAVNVTDYQRVSAGEQLFYIDASDYETQLETVQKQIDNYESNIADLQEAIATEYSRYADISG